MSTPENANTTGNSGECKIEFLPDDYPQYDLSFKLIFIGDSGVGKVALLQRQ